MRASVSKRLSRFMASFKRCLLTLICLAPGWASAEVPEIVVCDKQFHSVEFSCDVSETVNAGRVVAIQSNVLLENKILVGGTLIVDGDKIQAIQCTENPPTSDVLTLRCPETALSPTWVNPHEHTQYSYVYPSNRAFGPYAHRDEWRLERYQKEMLPLPYKLNYKRISAGAILHRLYHLLDSERNEKEIGMALWIELRHLTSGTGTLLEPAGIEGLVKNADVKGDYDVYAETLPFGYDTGAAFDSASCEVPPSELPTPELKAKDEHTAVVLHVGEGVNCLARNELSAVLAHHMAQPIGGRVSFIHALSASTEQLALMQASDITLIWSPRSNLSLYGTTADVAEFDRLGGRIALGTDWSLSGSFSMLETLSCASEYSERNNLNFSAHDFWEMATVNAAYSLGLELVTGKLAPGLSADFFLTPIDVVYNDGVSRADQYYEAVISTTAQELKGVWIDGQLIIGSADSGLQWPDHCVLLHGKRICAQTLIERSSLERLEVLGERTDIVQLWGDGARQTSCTKRISAPTSGASSSF